MHSAEQNTTARTPRQLPALLAASLVLVGISSSCDDPTPAPQHAHPSTVLQPAQAEPSAPETANARASTRWSASAFLTRHRFSYGVALRRGVEGPCDGATILVANGHDHTPQYSSQVPSLASCAPARNAESTSQRALYHADVATGDLNGDGVDEAIFAALAGADRRPSTGGLILVDSAGAEPWIDRGLAASSLAIGDLDGDGDLDLVVGTYWGPSSAADPTTPVWNGCGAEEDELAVAAPTVGQLLPRGIQGPIYFYLQDQGTFRRSLRIPSSSPTQLRLADVDLDGELDLVSAGYTVDVLYGPLAAPTPRRCERLHERSPGAYSGGVDITHAIADNGAAPSVLIAASAACSTTDECSRLERSGVWLWQRSLAPAQEARAPEETSGWEQSFAPIDGIASALRFADLSLRGAEAGTDLLVGRMIAAECSAERKLYGHYCIGAPLLALRGAWTDGSYGFPEGPQPLDIADPRGRSSARPMAARITPHVSAESRRRDALAERRCYAGAEARECKCDHCPSADARSVITYTGTGFIAEVAQVRDSAGPLAFNHSYGDRQISLRAPSSNGPVEVEWRVIPTPGFLVTSSSPIDLGGSSVFLQPLGDSSPAPAHEDPMLASRE